MVVAETQKNLDAGLAFKPRAKPANERRVTVISIKGDQAVVQECFVDDGRHQPELAVSDELGRRPVPSRPDLPAGSERRRATDGWPRLVRVTCV